MSMSMEEPRAESKEFLMAGEPDVESNIEPNETISFDDFTKIKLRVGRVTEARDHPNEDRLLIIQVDLGDEQRQICAGLKGHYSPEDLVGKNLIVVTNLAPRQLRGEISNGMLLAASTDDHDQVIALTTMADIAAGSSVS